MIKDVVAYNHLWYNAKASRFVLRKIEWRTTY